jgi:hypothetical protein
VLLSSSLIRKQFSHIKNKIIIENSITRPLWTPFSKTSEHEKVIINLIIECSPWNESHYINFNNTFVFLRGIRFLPFFKFFPVESFRIIKNKKEIVKSIEKVITSNKNANLIVSDNAILLKYFYKKEYDMSYIEHGAASYRNNVQKKDFRYLVKKVVSRLTSLTLDREVDNIYLSDNGKSYRSKEATSSGRGVNPITCDLSSEILSLYSAFIAKFELEHVEAYKELLHIKEESKNKKLFIYLPTGITPDEEYPEYLKSQLNQFDGKDDSIYLIKPHGHDTKRDYCNYFNQLDIKSFVFSNGVNVFIPVEFLILFFDTATLVSSYSTAHLYIDWWFDRRTIFCEVKGSSVNSELVNEYRHVYKDFIKIQAKQNKE